jgi:upstream activation factor subunit UAF30
MPRAPAKPKAEGGEKRESGLTKPMTLSPALAAIVGAKKDEKLARSEIIKRLWAYLKEKKLQVMKKIREIRAFFLARYINF